MKRTNCRKQISEICTHLHSLPENTRPDLRKLSSSPLVNSQIPSFPPILIAVLRQERLQLSLSEPTQSSDFSTRLLPLDRTIVLSGGFSKSGSTPTTRWLPLYIAHELGHWFLHAKPHYRNRLQLNLFETWQFITPESVIFSPEEDSITDEDQEANLFARELLLPESVLEQALRQCGYYPPIFYRLHHLNWLSFQEYATRLAEKIQHLLGFPAVWLRIRLIETGLLRDRSQEEFEAMFSG